MWWVLDSICYDLYLPWDFSPVTCQSAMLSAGLPPDITPIMLIFRLSANDARQGSGRNVEEAEECWGG